VKLIVGLEGEYLVSQDTTEEFETAILLNSKINKASEASYFWSRSFHRIWLYLAHFGFIRKMYLKICRLLFFNKEDYFIVLMGPKFQKCFPYFLRSGEKNCYFFDAWPVNEEKIVHFINDFDVNRIFVSSSQATRELNLLLKENKCFWIPEGINPDEYFFLPLNKKDIDVLSIGRKFQDYHDLIKEPLSKSNYNYKYATSLGSHLFPDRKALIHGLARSKISICFPRNVSHPEQVGHYETLTIRYLQAMLSKCLVIGHAPEEMIELFGYNPVIEVDMEHASDQLNEILKHIVDYNDLIERNYQEVLKNHTWKNRWEEIARIMFSH
jgi:hypothetical protein